MTRQRTGDVAWTSVGYPDEADRVSPARFADPSYTGGAAAVLVRLSGKV